MQTQSVTINFTGGIVSPGSLNEIMEAARLARVAHVRFGLRQQLMMDVPLKNFEQFIDWCFSKNIRVYKSKEALPNIVSSYPAAGLFTHDSWLREGVYKDIFDLFNYTPQLKVNICDCQQCFVPFFTGHINWISSSSEHFWHLYIRFPKTGRLYKWKDLVYTNDLAIVSKKIEQEILQDQFLFYGNEEADGNLLHHRVKSLTAYVHKPAADESTIDFSLPYYEGFNKSGNQLWLGIYRRDELFPVDFLIDVCQVCLTTRVGQLYTTPWKSIIIKNMDSSNRKLWDYVLGKYRINVRHAANELNWQVEDQNEEGLQLKRNIIRHFDKEDVRTYGLCFAVQTKVTSSMFGSVVIRKQPSKNPHRLRSLERYDILYKKKFNPNEREAVLFREGVEREHIGIYLASLCKFFYEQDNLDATIYENAPVEKETVSEIRQVHQCKHCLTVYDSLVGDEEQNVPAGTDFQNLPSEYHCSVCNSGLEDFRQIEESVLAKLS